MVSSAYAGLRHKEDGSESQIGGIKRPKGKKNKKTGKVPGDFLVHM